MSESSSRPAETPLESWKAIAAHLNRDVRTVRRWEASEGLPVHRHRHLARSTIYAYPSELDAWRATRRPAPESVAAGWLGRRARTLALTSAAVVALLSAGDGRVIGTVSTAAQDRGMTVRQIWAGADVDITGAPTPDGRFLTFTDWSTGDVAVRNLATGEQRRITNKGSWASSPEYADHSIVSPDGKQIAYSWDNKDRVWELRVASFNETAQRVPPRAVYHNEDVNYVEPFAWSPDGKQVLTLLQRKDRTLQVALISAADGSARILKSLEWRWPSKMSFSPDGRYVAYDARVRQDSADRDIFVLSVDGRQEVPVIQHPAIDHAPVWTPDGEHIVFLSDRRGRAGLWTIHVGAGKPLGAAELLKADIGAVSPLGLFAFTRDGSFYYGVYTGTEDVYTAELNPETGAIGAPIPLTEHFTGSNLAGVWSPNGRQFAHFSRRGPLLQGPGNMAVVIRSVDTGEEREFFSNLEFDRRWPTARWFPDGRSLLLTTADNLGRGALQRMDARTGVVQLLPGARSTNVPGPLPCVSPDGRTIYYFPGAEASGTSPIMAYDIGSGRERAIAGSPAFGHQVWSMALSSDGKQLAVAEQATLQVIPVDGGTAREVFRAQPPRSLTRSGLAWTSDDRFLLFTERAGDLGSSVLWRISVEGGQPRNVPGMNSLAFPSVHPDGRHITFTAGKSEGAEVWVMQNFLPTLKAAR